MNGIIYLFKICFKYNKKYIFLLYLKQIFLVVSTVISIVIPRYILDSLFVYHDVKFAFYNVLIMVIVLFFSGSVNIYLLNKIIEEKMVVFKKFQIELNKKVLVIPLEKIESKEYLDLKNKAEQFIYCGGNGFATVLETSFNILGKILNMLIVIGIIFQLNILLIVMITIIVLIICVINYYANKKKIEINIEKSVQERKNMYFNIIMQNFQYGKEIRANNCINWLLNKYENQLDKMQIFYKRLSNNDMFFGLITFFLSILQQLVSYFYLIMEVGYGSITVGEFSLYLTSITSFSTGLKDTINILMEMSQYTNYYESFREFWYLSTDEKCFEKKFEYKYGNPFQIKFCNVFFKYCGSQNFTLKNINTTINSKDIISIVGENGAGKSTFIKLLLKLYKPTSGEILFNNINIQEIDTYQYLSIFSTVFQDFKLFSFSVQENIALDDNSNIVEKDMDMVLDKVGLLNKILSFDNKFLTTIYTDFDLHGYYPSGGEAQKLAIARALYKKFSILILDEPTASLDPQSEAEINSILEEKIEQNTIIYISHRMSSTKNSSKILVFLNGEIIEEGSHLQLMEVKGIYKHMFECQAKNY